MKSITLIALKSFFRVAGKKNFFAKEGDSFIEAIPSCKNPEGSKPSKKIYKEFHVTSKKIGKGICYKVAPKENKTAKKIIYLHGSGYVMDSSPFHWSFVQKVVKNTNAIMYCVDYPMAPEYNCDDASEMILELYQNLVRNHDPKDIIFMGDSAGGGISLAFALCIKEAGLPQAGHYILISPSVDLSCQIPIPAAQKDALEKSDAILSYKSFDTICDLWRGERERTDWHVTPVHGDMTDLGPITIFAGTDDLLTPFTKQMVQTWENKGVHMNFYLRKDMPHDYVLFPLKQGRQDLELICDIIIK